jgi:8-oxo-dGTP pyrophosphatase MutT (NUDIX family)
VSTINQQVGALPYRLARDGEAEIMLVTSRGTGQWIIPKGWPMDGFTNPQAAAREAYEEAGLVGQIGTRAIGSYAYEKSDPTTDQLFQFRVEVFLLRVDRQLAFWPEAHQRRTAWVSLYQVRSLVRNLDLCRLIEIGFAPEPLSLRIRRTGQLGAGK